MRLPAERRLATLACVVVLVLAAGARWAGAANYTSTSTSINQLGLGISNYGFFGNNFVNRSPSFEYPLGQGYEHLVRGGLWIGAHANDAGGAFTGVTTACLDGSPGISPVSGTEFTPASEIVLRSNLPTSPNFSPLAVSNLDYLTTYDDQTPRSQMFENHRPLGVHVSQAIFTWAFGDLAHVVFTHLTIRNDGAALTGLSVGIYSELASGNKNAYASWPPSSSSGPGNWYTKAWLQYDAGLRLLREHYCLNQPVPAGCNLAAVPPWCGLLLLTPPTPGQSLTLAAKLYGPGNPAYDQDVERYAWMSAGTIADLTNPDVMPGTGDPVELLAVGPFASLAPGDSLTLDFAWVGGADVADIQAHARTAQQVYDANYSPATATEIALVTSTADERGAHLAWSASEPGWRATLERAESGGAWREVTTLAADGNGRIAYDDPNVAPGARYGYRLMAGAQAYGETWIEVPERLVFALLGSAPNPIQRGDWSVSFAVPAAGPVELELFDSSGRRVLRRAYDAPSAGVQRVSLGRADDLRAGVYLVRLTHEHRSLARRFVVLH